MAADSASITLPPIRSLLSFPLTAVVGVAALAATLLWWVNPALDVQLMDVRAWHGQPWRLITHAFPHGDFLFLAFGLYWLWVLGTRVEGVYGTWKSAGLMLFFTAGAATVQFGLFEGMYGLGGMLYGLFGLLSVLSRHDPRFLGAMPSSTVAVFLGWFAMSCVLSATGIWMLGIAALAGGAILGALVGLVLVSRGGRRAIFVCLLCLAVSLACAGATVGRAHVNVTGQVARDLAFLGYLDLQAENPGRAEARYRQALKLDGSQADWWQNLGIACHRLGRLEDALDAYQRALDRRPGNQTMIAAVAQGKAQIAYRKQIAGDNDEAIRLYREALSMHEQQPWAWHNLGIAYHKLGQIDSARDAYQKAVMQEPANQQFQASLRSVQDPDEVK